MIPLETAIAIVDGKIGSRRLPTEVLSVREAAGRYLATDQRSRLDLPPFDKAAVDGYAVLAGDDSREYRLVATVAAGQAGVGVLTPGTTVKVMTGAPVPDGTAKVVMVEQATECDGLVRFEAPGTPANVCKRAEDVAGGDTVVKRGSRLGALEIANLIGCGIEEVEVARRPRITVLSTGDEIVDCVADLSPGRIMNTNGPLLHALAHKRGLEVVAVSTVPDDRSRLASAIKRALAEADLVVLSGGVSAGDYDFVPEVITDSGMEIHFSRVAVKPGMPTLFATGNSGILFGLPGNPVAVYLTFHLFVARATAHLSGGSFHPLSFKMHLADDFSRRSADRTGYTPCRIRVDGLLEPVPYHGSAHLVALMQADGFFVVPQGVESLPAGAAVSFVTFWESGLPDA